MSKILKKYHKWLAFTCLITIVCLILTFRDLQPAPNNTESMLNFISQPKDIQAKDFYDVVEQILPKPTQNQNQTQTKEQPKTPLKLHAIVNQNALINETWIRPNEIFIHDNEEYILTKIARHGVYLKHKDNPSDIIYLEVFTIPQELLLQIR